MSTFTSSLQIGARIGGGAFGEVFAAMDPVHGDVAVKILKRLPNENGTDWAVRKVGLLQEGKRLANASHPNVVRVHYVVESQRSDAVLLGSV